MQFKTRFQRRSYIDITPMIDVVFLLLLFFMVSTTLEKNPGIKVKLPEASKKDSSRTYLPDQVTLTAQNKLFINDKIIERSNIQKALQVLIKKNKEKTLVIHADGRVRHKEVVFVMNAAKEAGFVKLSIATTPITEKNK